MAYLEPKTEQDWQAECDARTLAQAKMIEGDKTRRSTAMRAALNLAEKEKQEADAMRAVAGQSRLYPNSPELYPKEG